MSSLESTLLKWSVKGYLLSAGLCHLAAGELSNILKARCMAVTATVTRVTVAAAAPCRLPNVALMRKYC